MDYAKVGTVLARVLVLNWFVAAIKIWVGLVSGSMAILADGLHSFFDGGSNIVGLIGIKFARRPKDAAHPYGYTKYEAIAALGVAGFMILGAYEIGKGIVGRLFHPVSPEISFLFIGVLVGALAIDAVAAFYEYRWAKRLQSKLLHADARHTITHLLTTSSIITGSIAVMAGYAFVDSIFAALVLLMVMKLAWRTFKDVTGVLIDSALLDPEKVKKIAEGHPEVISCHDIRSRGDRHSTFIDLHIVVNSGLSVEEAHRVSHEVREKIMTEIKGVNDVIVHIEPPKQKI